MNEGCAAQTT